MTTSTALSFADMWHFYLVDQLRGDYPDAQSLSIADLEHRYYARQCGLPYPPNLSISDLKFASYTSGIADPAVGLDLLKNEALLFADPKLYSGTGPLTNNGINGSTLNLQLGTTASADTNDPLWLDTTNAPYWYYAGGTAGGTGAQNLATHPYFSGLEITEELEVEWEMSSADWGPGRPVSRWGVGVSAWLIEFGNSTLTFFYQNPANQVVFLQLAGIPMPSPNEWARYKLTVDLNNGAGGKTMTLYRLVAGAWSIVSNGQVSEAGTTSIKSPTDCVVALANDAGGAGAPQAMKISYAAIRRGIGGQEVLSFNPGNLGSWVIGRAPSGRKSALVISRPFFLFGADDIMQILAANATSLNVGLNGPYTCLSYWRRFGLTDYYWNFFGKAIGTPTGNGWRALGDINSRNFLSQLDIAAAAIYTPIGGGPDGTLEMIGTGRDVPGLGYAFSNNTQNSAAGGTASLSNNANFDVGSITIDMAQAVDAEFYGICFFPRLLTTQEIRQVNAYYGVG